MSTGLELSEPTHFSSRAAFQPALHPGVTSPGWSPRTVMVSLVTQMAQRKHLGTCDPAQAVRAAHRPLGWDRPPVPARWLFPHAERGWRGERGFMKQPGCSFALPQHLRALPLLLIFLSWERSLSVCLSHFAGAPRAI